MSLLSKLTQWMQSEPTVSEEVLSTAELVDITECAVLSQKSLREQLAKQEIKIAHTERLYVRMSDNDGDLLTSSGDHVCHEKAARRLARFQQCVDKQLMPEIEVALAYCSAIEQRERLEDMARYQLAARKVDIAQWKATQATADESGVQATPTSADKINKLNDAANYPFAASYEKLQGSYR